MTSASLKQQQMPSPSRRLTDSLDASVTIETPEQIALSYSLAGIGSRGTAAFIDFLVCLAAWVLAIFLLSLIPGTLFLRVFNASAGWIFALVILTQFVIQWGYYVIAEGVFDGQTIGKRILKLRTVMDGGYSVTFGASAIRNIFRLLDVQPFPTYFIGIFTSMMNSSGKRLGDLVAGTLVVREHLPKMEEDHIPEAWRRFADETKTIQAKGLSTIPAAQVSAYVGEYRKLTTEYAQLRTTSRGQLTSASFYLSRLVASGHNVLYRQKSKAFITAFRYIMYDIPKEIRRSWRPISLAALLLFGPMLVTYGVLVKYPEHARMVMPEEMMSRANLATEREARGEGYVTVKKDAQPVASSSIMVNNIQVTFSAFAAGITAGILTVIILVFNGVMIGAVMAIFATREVSRVLFAFLVPHGVLELTAICIGAGAGLLIAAAFWIPGTLSRRDALVANGKRAITLILGASLLLVVAGIIEGMISPLVWPLSYKLAVSATTAILLVWYLTRGREKASKILPENAAENS